MKKPTIIRFIGTRASICFAVMLIGMCVLFIYTIDRAEYDTARWTLRRESILASRHIIRMDDGSLSIDKDTRDDIEECYVAVIDDEGNIINGELPEELGKAAGRAPANDRFQMIRKNGVQYYVMDRVARRFHHKSSKKRPHRDQDLEGYYVRTVICSDELKTVYQSIERLFFAFVLLMLLMAVLGWIWLYKRSACPILEMCDNVNKLDADPGYSHHIEDTAYFYETEVMTDAYNKLMNRNERLIRQQEEFNENVSHELRTPVAVIRSEVEFLQDLCGKELSPEAEKALKVMHNQSERINAMITELKYMAKMDRENFALNKEAMELSDLAESVCEDLEDMAPGKNKFIYHWKPAEAEMDILLIMIAVRNLITNASKYSPEGSRIDLYTGVKDGMAFLRIADNGIGIPEDDLDEIFDPYFQVKGERNSEGFGLGLALTMKIAKKHGGDVLVESEEGKGSTFTLVIPVTGQAEH